MSGISRISIQGKVRTGAGVAWRNGWRAGSAKVTIGAGNGPADDRARQAERWWSMTTAPNSQHGHSIGDYGRVEWHNITSGDLCKTPSSTA